MGRWHMVGHGPWMVIGYVLWDDSRDRKADARFG
jgi:hypothetical protein